MSSELRFEISTAVINIKRANLKLSFLLLKMIPTAKFCSFSLSCSHVGSISYFSHITYYIAVTDIVFALCFFLITSYYLFIDSDLFFKKKNKLQLVERNKKASPLQRSRSNQPPVNANTSMHVFLRH